MQRHRNGFEHGSFGKRHAGRKGVNDMLRDRDIFGKGPVTTVFSARDAKHLALITKVDCSAETIAARTAGDGGIESDPVSCREAPDRGAGSCNRPRSFVTHDKRWIAAPRGPIVSVHIAAADAAGCDADKNIMRPRSGFRHRHNFELTVAGELQGFHSSCGLFYRRLGAGGKF